MDTSNHYKNRALSKSQTNRIKMKIITLSLLLLSISMAGFCQTSYFVTTSSDLFIPDNLIINSSDTINFVLTSSHNAVEVSLATWNANDTTPLPGFAMPFGGGLVLPGQLTLGTHYYICTPHVSNTIPMKAIIIVQSPAGIAENPLLTNISIYPNPSSGKFQFSINGLPSAKNYNLEIHNMQGELIYQSKITNLKSEIDLSNQVKGIYFIKIYNGQTVLTKKIVMQ